MENISQMSLLEVAIYLMEQKKSKQAIKTLIQEVLEMKGLDDPDSTLATQLYIDITTSSKFVYMGNGEWDLKTRQSLDEFDKDGSAFNSKDDEYEDEDEIVDDIEEADDEDEEDSDEDDEYEDDEDTDEYDDEYEDEEDDEDSDDEYEDDEDSIIDDDLVERYSEDDFNEDKYNDLMDDYEDMYEE